ncbi:phosphatase PAP2 family protein [Clostridium sp. DL1XJH146]
MVDIIQSIDLQVLGFIKNFSGNIFLDKLMILVTTLGNKGAIWIVILFCLILNKKYRRAGLMGLAALILSAVLGELIIKNIVQRARPFITYPVFKLIIEAPSLYSFPSGHTASSFAVAGILAGEFKKYRSALWILAILIAFSRLYLFVHYPSDIIGGIILGLVCAWIIRKVFNRTTRELQT